MTMTVAELSALEAYSSDLASMDLEALEGELESVTDTIDTETGWQEALAARIKQLGLPQGAAPDYMLMQHEVQSGVDRVKHAEVLIAQLPKDHDGRNTWLMNYGQGAEGAQLRRKRGLVWDTDGQAARVPGDEA